MTRLVDDEASILAQARRALSPTSANEQRVLQNLRAQLATPPNPVAHGRCARSAR